MNELQLFFQHLKQPEYVHVLLNPLPLYGMAAGAFVLFYSMIRSQENSASLLWLALMGIVSWQAFEFGEKGYDRVFAMSNIEAQQWLEVHMYRAEKLIWAFYGTALAALGALSTRRRWPRASKSLSVVTLILALASVGAAGWINHAGGLVRHSEFRAGPPMPNLLPPPAKRHSYNETEKPSSHPKNHSDEHSH